MTDVGTATTAVEQAFFRRAEDGTVDVVTSSLDDEQAELSWLALVRPYLGGTAPESAPPALVYVTFPDGFAAVLHRGVQRPGTVVTHALLGMATELTPGVALTTPDWSGWRAEPPADRRMARLRPDDLRVPDTTARRRADAVAMGDMLARSLAWLLQSPDAPLGLLGCPAKDRITLVWGLLEIASPLLAQREWTFATDGDPDPDGRPAAITFFTTPPARHAAAAHRNVVDLRGDQGASPQNEYRANALVYRFEYGVDPPGLNTAPATLAVPPPVPVVATPPLPVAPVRTATVAARPAGWSAELVRNVVAARGEFSLEAALTALENAVAGLDDRDDVRAALESSGWGASAIRRLPFVQQEALYDRIVWIGFGATGTGLTNAGARADAQRLAESSPSDALVRALARAAVGDELAPALARRWLRQNRPVAPDPMSGLGVLGRFLYRRGRLMTPRRERFVLAALLVFALLLSFLLGHLLGGAL